MLKSRAQQFDQTMRKIHIRSALCSTLEHVTQRQFGIVKFGAGHLLTRAGYYPAAAWRVGRYQEGVYTCFIFMNRRRSVREDCTASTWAINFRLQPTFSFQPPTSSGHFQLDIHLPPKKKLLASMLQTRIRLIK